MPETGESDSDPVLQQVVEIISLDAVATSGYLDFMRAVGLKQLKDRLSEYVRLAGSGEIVLVTHRDRVVAELGPPRPERSPMIADAFLADAVRSGLITPPALSETSPPPNIPVAKTDELLRELDRDREDR